MGDWLSSLLSGAGSGIGNFMAGNYGDPNLYMAGMSTLGGLGGNLFNAYQQNKNYQNQAQAARRAQQLAGSPMDPSNYYKPISDAEQTARMRAINADLVSRGIPLDSSYATNLTAEQMAGTESQRLQQAYGLAGQQRQQQLGTMGMGNVPMYGNMGPFGMGALGNYFGQQSQQNAQKAALDKILASIRGGGGQGSDPSSGLVDSSTLQGMNLHLSPLGSAMGSENPSTGMGGYDAGGAGGAY